MLKILGFFSPLIEPTNSKFNPGPEYVILSNIILIQFLCLFIFTIMYTLCVCIKGLLCPPKIISKK